MYTFGKKSEKINKHSSNNDSIVRLMSNLLSKIKSDCQGTLKRKRKYKRRGTLLTDDIIFKEEVSTHRVINHSPT